MSGKRGMRTRYVLSLVSTKKTYFC